MNLLVPVDLTNSSRTVIDCARKTATAMSAKVWLLHIADAEPDFVGYDAGPQTERDDVAKKFHEEHRQLQALAEELRAGGLACVALLVQGPIVEKILSEAVKLPADMIVIGSHGKGAVKRLLVGSVSEGLLRESPVPLLIVPTRES